MVCPQCGRSHTGKDGVCNTCQIRSFLNGRKLPGVVTQSAPSKVVEAKKETVDTHSDNQQILDGMVVRMCMECGAIYYATRAKDDSNLMYVGSCKYCGLTTGFFETAETFLGHVTLYGIEKVKIKDIRILGLVEKHFKLDGGVYRERK